MKTWFTADPHFDHPGVLKHCTNRGCLQPGDILPNGKWVSEEVKAARTQAMNEAMAAVWNGQVDSKDTVYIAGDFCWKNHRKWINALNGKKILIVGNHDKMPQDALDLFKPDWTCEDVTVLDAIKTVRQFREVHQKLVRKIGGILVTINHSPEKSWFSAVHGAWMIHGHVHGRILGSLPGHGEDGMILDVGWDVWGRLVEFEEVKFEMRKKLMMQSQNFIDHVLHGKPLGRRVDDDEQD